MHAGGKNFSRRKRLCCLLESSEYFATFHLCYFSTSILVAILSVEQRVSKGVLENSNRNSSASKSSHICLL